MFSVLQLEMNKQFYKTFPITNTLRSQFSWTRYYHSVAFFVLLCFCIDATHLIKLAFRLIYPKNRFIGLI